MLFISRFYNLCVSFALHFVTVVVIIKNLTTRDPKEGTKVSTMNLHYNT